MATVQATAGRTLKVDAILGTLDAADRDTLTAWLRDESVPTTRIEMALRAHSKTVGVDCTASHGAINKWRAKNA
jgi:hypothetical protein